MLHSRSRLACMGGRWALLALLAGGAVGCESTGAFAGSDPTRTQVRAKEADVEDDSDHRTFAEKLRWWEYWGPFKTEVPEAPADSFVIRPEGLAPDKPIKGTLQAELAGAREYFRRGDYDKAEVLYHRIAERDRIPPAVGEEARYFEAECLRLQGYYPKAADTYVDLLNKFPNTIYREQAVQHMYDIANYWLDDTREKMRETREQQDGKRWWVWPRFVSFERSKPLLDREGRAIEKLEQVRYNDIQGPLADKALFWCGSIKLFNENYKEADYYFSQLAEKHKNSPYAPQAVELAIMCKHLSTGGSDYDGRKAAEARKLVQVALANYPELANDKDKREFLVHQLANIDYQQAEKDYKIAEFYRRTGHPGAAYFYYELVRKRYPETPYGSKLAPQRIEELRHKLAKDNQELPPEGPAARPAPAPGAGAPQRPGMLPTLPQPNPVRPEFAPAPRPVGQ
jgi:outer membrane protein assembly factor BamD (BamD/ComL family)